MNEEIKKKIESEGKRLSTDGRGVVNKTTLHNFTQGAVFGYSLAEAEIERLKKLIEKAWLAGSQNTRVKIKTKNYGPDFVQYDNFLTENNLK